MNRRNFFTRFAKTIATVAVAQQLVKAWVIDNLAVAAPLHTIEDVDKFVRLPYYLAQEQIQAIRFKTWDVLFSKIEWKPKMGETLRGVSREL